MIADLLKSLSDQLWYTLNIFTHSVIIGAGLFCGAVGAYYWLSVI